MRYFIKTEYEEKLKGKFHFEFLENNFNKAIKIAEEQKANQNLDLSKSNN